MIIIWEFCVLNDRTDEAINSLFRLDRTSFWLKSLSKLKGQISLISINTVVILNTKTLKADDGCQCGFLQLCNHNCRICSKELTEDDIVEQENKKSYRRIQV